GRRGAAGSGDPRGAGGAGGCGWASRGERGWVGEAAEEGIVGESRVFDSLETLLPLRDLPLRLRLSLRCPLLVVLPPSRQPHLHLHAASLQVHLERHERQALLPYLHREPPDLLLVRQELSLPHRLVVELVGPRVRVDLRADEPELAAADVAVGVDERAVALAQRLHLAADEHQPGLERLVDLVVEPRLAVSEEHLLVLLPLGHGETLTPVSSRRAPGRRR